MKLNICAMSDLHGCLLDNIQPCDVVCICGDISPIEYDRNIPLCKRWFCTTFFDWVRRLPCQKVILIAGNHDFFIEEFGYGDIVRLIAENGMYDKLTYLEDNSCYYNGLVFYGTPWVKGPTGWPFYSANIEDKYAKIQRCDILLTHQPPSIGKLGVSYPNQPIEHDFSSDRLRQAIANVDGGVRYALCGHIHSGLHEWTYYPTNDVDTMFINVSINDEDYNPTYEPTYFEIEINE